MGIVAKEPARLSPVKVGAIPTFLLVREGKTPEGAWLSNHPAALPEGTTR